MEPSAPQCSRCGAPIAADAPEGFCLRCLVRAGAALHQSRPRPHRLGPGGFGDYELLEEIGRGGMGHVYRARQISLDRIVALKVLSAGELAAPRVVERFQIEAEAAASLDHPNIVPVYQVGEVEGWNFFSMRLVEGPTLARELAKSPMSTKRAVRLLIRVARAIQHAHERGVLHRDIKPGNIILDGADEPHVTDFGLAKLAHKDTELTLTHVALGTPAYMSPEQAAGRIDEVTTAADVYGLGAVFFEMLTGRAPFKGQTAMAIAQQVVDEDPPRPGSLNAEVPPELSVICLKCLEKEPARRYVSAGALADDLERFSRGEPIQAMSLTPEQIVWRWAKRRPQMAALMLVCLLSLLAGGIGVTWQWRTAERARLGESAALEKATDTVIDLYTHSGINAAKANDPTRAALWFAQAAAATKDPSRQAQELARQMAWRGEAATAVRAFDSGIGQVGDIYWNSLQTALVLQTRRGTTSAVWNVATEQRWYPNGISTMESATWAHRASWVVYHAGGRVQVADFPEGRTLAEQPSPEPVTCLALSPDDRWIAVGSRKPFLWEWNTGSVAPLPAGLGSLTGLEFSRNGRLLLMTGATNRAVCALTNLAAGFLFAPMVAHGVRANGFLNEGEHCFTMRPGGRVEIRDSETGAVVETQNIMLSGDDRIHAASSDGRFLGRFSGTLLERGHEPKSFPTHKNRFEALDFSPDNQWLLTGSADATVRMWHLPDGETRPPIGWHQIAITAVAFSPDQRFVATGQSGGSLVRVWRLAEPVPHRSIPLPSAGSGVEVSRDSQLLLLRGWGHDVDPLRRARVHRIADGNPVGPEMDSGGQVLDAEFLPDGSAAALACLTEGEGPPPGTPNVQLWDYHQGRRLGEIIPLASEPLRLNVHPSGNWIGVYDVRGRLLEVEVATRKVHVRYDPKLDHDQPGYGNCTYSPDGALLVGFGANVPPVVWERSAGRLQPLAVPSPARAMDVAFHGSVMATVSLESRLDFLQVPDLTPAAGSIPDADWLFVGRFSPDGSQFLSAGRSTLARIWDWRRGVLQCSALQHEGEVFSAAFIPGTDVVATGGLDRQIHLWNRHTGLPVRSPLAQPGLVMDLAVTPDGQYLIRGNYRGNDVRIYRVADLLPRASLPPADALLLAQIDASAEILKGGLEPLSAKGWFQRWQQFRAKHPDWHRW